ncbi:flagellar export chaperone FlgN, partial [Erwinia amylovora]|uniref:flagellar export chaperone FlgN n=1 Tax=Erwinia amylovora TaxID=552 RepID=UPI00200B1143
PELMQRWTAIQATTLKLRDTNTHNGMLLNHQINHNEQALQVLKPYHSQKFYGPDGQAISSRSVSLLFWRLSGREALSQSFELSVQLL